MRLPFIPGALFALVGAIALAQSTPAVAATIGVNTTADETDSDAHCSLREAISAANDDSKGPGGDCAKGSGADTIKVPRGHFALSIAPAGEDDNAGGDLDIRSNLTIAGAVAGATTIDANGIDRVLQVLPARIATIRRVTVTGGQARDGADGSPSTGGTGAEATGNMGQPGADGGGILNAGNLTIVDSVISGNDAGDGGRGGSGRGGDGSTPATGNGGNAGRGNGGFGGDGGSGGGIFTSGVVTLTRTKVTGNTAGAGGASGAGIGGNGGGTPDGNGGKGGDGFASIGGSGGNGGGIAESAGGSVVVGLSTSAGNSSGAGGPSASGQGGAGGGTGAGSGAGGAGGEGVGGIGGPGGSGGGIYAADPVVVTRSLISGNVTGAGGRNGDTTGGPGGVSTGQNGVAGDGGDSIAATAGGGGFGGGLAVLAGSTIVNDTLSGNHTGAGGDVGGGTGGRGGNAINVAGNGGDGDGGIAGSGGDGAGLLTDSGAWTLRNGTIAANALGGAGAASTGVGGAGGTGGNASGAPGSGRAGVPGSPGEGGAVFTAQTDSANPLTLANTIIAGNDTPGCGGIFPGVIVGARDISLGDTSCPGANVDPKLGPLAANGGPTKTRALGAGSPAIDAVPARGAGCPTTDQRGVKRPNGRACDIGAYEHAPPTVRIGRASDISATRGRLHGRLNPNARSTTYHFEYGKTTAYGNATRIKKQRPGTSTVGVLAAVTGLRPRTTYHYRLVATNADGTRRGADGRFKTGA
jgi:CSLREA domain-containing protein